MLINEVKNIKIVFYSGTGNTQKVAQCFEACVKEKGISVQTYSLIKKNGPQVPEEDLLLVVYAVHALNAPEAVYQWINGLPKVNGKRAAVVSVSGGGEICPNTACRVGCIQKLEKKGFEVIYETMLVMPSNWIVATHEALAVKLLEVLPCKVEFVVTDILSGVRKRTKPLWIDRFLSWAAELEKIGTRAFGKRIKCSAECNGCGNCFKGCPAGNIRMEGDRPVFGEQCHMCLNCLYGCPQKALTAGMLNFVIIKEGYSLKALELKKPGPESINVEELTKGFLWAGVRNYLLK